MPIQINVIPNTHNYSRQSEVAQMAIADRVKEAIDSLHRGDPTNALIQISIAIDATAKKLHPRAKVGERCKTFLRENQAFIIRMAFGLLELRGDVQYTWATDPRGYKTHEEVLYHLVRCGLLHDGELPPNVRLTNESVFGMAEDGAVLVSTKVIWGMILAVIACDVVKGQLPPAYTASIAGKKLSINDLWGKKKFLYDLVRAENKAPTV